LRKARGWGDDELVVMYSGNMGLGHRFGEILAAARALRDKPVRWVFYGDGRRRVEIDGFMRAHPECRLEMHPYAPAEQLAAHLRSADVHLASLDPAWTGTMVPSKLQGIFAAGRPVVFIGGADSSIGRWVAASGGGWVVPPDDRQGLLVALAEAQTPAVRAGRGRAAQAFAAQHFDEATNVGSVAAILTRRRRTER
jgi:glycosyltransferase involved in cell wall biosynthesis